MKAQILMNNTIVVEPSSETERYALKKFFECVGDRKLSDVLEIGNENLFEENSND